MSAAQIPESPSSLTLAIDAPFQLDDTDAYVRSSLVGDPSRERESDEQIANFRDSTSPETTGDTNGGEQSGNVPESLVGDANREREFRGRISTVQDYASLPTNWDTYGGLPASERPIAFSTDLLGKLLRNPVVPPPYVSPISTGVYVEWAFRDMKLYFEADNESVLFVAERSGHTIKEGEDPYFDVAQAACDVELFFNNAL